MDKEAEHMDVTYEVDPAFEKLLSDNRDRYIRQSCNTHCGQVAALPGRELTSVLSDRPERASWLSKLRDFAPATRSYWHASFPKSRRQILEAH